MKEVALFAVASSALVYFLSPTSEEPAVVPEEIMQEIERVQAPLESANDSWGYENEDDYEDENFVFGEPMKLQDEDFDSENSAEALNAISKIKVDADKRIATSKNAKLANPNIGNGKERERRTRNSPVPEVL
ncbi:MAG: hypothetical protein ABJM99_09575 [Parasphingorhabdus sp.]